jgi:PadR family transcriptional regulator PadR
MTKAEAKVMEAIESLGGEVSGFQIHQRLVRQSKWAWLWGISLGGMYNVLERLERRGVLWSRWGEATAERGWHRPRIYRISLQQIAASGKPFSIHFGRTPPAGRGDG